MTVKGRRACQLRTEAPRDGIIRQSTDGRLESTDEACCEMTFPPKDRIRAGVSTMFRGAL